jgi:aromatic-L-amino-acid decarboxylase
MRAGVTPEVKHPSTNGPSPLEPSSAEMRSMIDGAADLLVRHIQAHPDADASDSRDVDAITRALREPAPSAGQDLESLLRVVEDGAAKGFNTAGPGYLAFIPGGGLFAAALADFVAAGLNRFVGLWSVAPAFAQMEATALRWLLDLFDYPPEARGIFTSGGSLANLSAIVTARRALLGEDFLRGTLYTSDQAHASVAKAAVLAGFPWRNVRKARSTPELRVDVEALRELIRADRAAGLQPFLIVGNAGTTNTGAVDPLVDLADLAAGESMWLHADAAYGGFFQLTDRGRGRLRGIERADSITLDPHKGLFLPYGTGSLLVRDGAKLREAHHVGAEYLQDLAPEGDIPNFAEYSPELSREFRGLRVWLPVKLHGLDAFRAALDEKLDLARFLFEALRDTPGFEVPWEPELTVVPFRYRPRTEGVDVEEFNHRLLDRINASRRVFLSSTMIDGRFVIRACVVSVRTHRDRVEEAVDIIRTSARELDG